MEKIADLFQQLASLINIEAYDRLWIAVGVAVFIVLVMWFTLERAKMAMILLAVYSIGLIILHTQIGGEITKNLNEKELNYAQIAWAFLPVVALAILGIKKRKRRKRI